MNNLPLSSAQLHEEIKNLRTELSEYKQVSEQPTNELHTIEERFSLAIQGTSDGLWDWNLETDEVYLSPRWKSMLGYDVNELTHHLDTWKKFIFDEDIDRLLKAVQDYLSGETEVFEVEIRMQHKNGHCVFVLSRAFKVMCETSKKNTRLVGTHLDITERKRAESFGEKHVQILEMIGVGNPAKEIYNAIALLYEGRHPGLYCSMLELEDDTLLHGGAPSLPKEYCEAVHGLKNGPEVGSCGTSTYTGKCVLVEDIATDPKWEKIKSVALPHGLRCCWSQPIKDSSGKVLGAFGMYYKYIALPNEAQLSDLVSAARLAGVVMERDQAQKRIRELAYTDELTQLASRAHFYQYIAQLIKTCERHQHTFALLYLDLDNFKDVNDSLGHDMGDIMLKMIADRLKNTCREIDFVARLSGDEFCILVDKAEGDYAANVAQRCLTEISQPIELAGRKLTPACSIGIAYYPSDGKDISTLLKVADTSLYTAKENGKNQYAFYKPEFTEEAEYRFQIEQCLKQAIDNQELSLVYQPQFNVKTGDIVGVEALSRWHHPQLGHISPVEFIPIAERIGMIKPLTEWVLNTACGQAVDWINSGCEPLFMAVNISPTHFLDKDIVALIIRIIEQTGITPSNLKLEVTEGVVQTDPENLVVFKKLKQLGIKLAIDDFGTGYSSFASLKHLDIDYLKIDKYFIDDMLINQHSRILVTAMIELGHRLGHGIIAEGVETEKQLNVLRRLNCDVMQGYLFGKPMAGDKILALLTNDITGQRQKNKNTAPK
jgi:diguanylate cyclase (GGDEF)-like protein/PAS domain S-box-containing protein